MREAESYLAGIFDGEGSVPKPGNRQIVVCSGTEDDILGAVQVALDEMGLPWKRYTNGIYESPHAQGYTVKLTRKAAIQEFYDRVPFQSVRKRARMKLLLEKSYA